MPKIATPKVRPSHVNYVDPYGSPEKYEFLKSMLELKKSSPRWYRELFGIMRALYLTSNPRPPRDREGKKLHARALAKVRPIDYRRAKDFAAVAELNLTHGAVAA